MSRLNSLVVLLALIYQAEAATILAVYPSPSISHQVVFRHLTNELLRQGHEVVVITTDPQYPKEQKPENLTEIDVLDVSYNTKKKVRVENGNKNSYHEQVKIIMRVVLDIFEKQCNFKEVQDIFKNKNKKFDLIFAEAWLRFVLGFTHVVKAPVIAVSSFGVNFDNYDVIGAPTHPLLYPQSLMTRLYNLSLWEKITQYYDWHSMMNYYYGKLQDLDNAVIKRIFGKNTSDVSELQNKVDMLFLNTFSIWEGNYPVPPSVVYMGGIHQTPQKEIEKDLKQKLDASVKGVIYVSFGTNVATSLFPADKIQIMIEAFSQLPYNFLWKWNQDELPGRTQNIEISKWFPQSDLLRHPNIKLFITQGGLQSTHEALTAGVPLLGIPMMSDQWYNVEKYVHHKIGLQLELGTLEVESLKNAIETLVGDKSCRANVERLTTLMNDQPVTPLERTMWWTEHLLRHGGARARYLRAPAANMPWTQYYEIYLVLIVLIVITTMLTFSLLVIFSIVKYVKRLLSLRNQKLKVVKRA